MYPALLIHGEAPDVQSMTAHYLADGDAGAAQTIADMRALVDRGLKSPQIYTLARQIVQSVPAYEEGAEVRAVYDWVLRNIRFVKGVIGKQSLQTSEATLRLRAGQCTDLSILEAALLMTIGYPVRFVAVATDPAAPDQFSHIYPEVSLDGAWIPIDAARAQAQFGVAPRHVYRREEFPILDRVGNMPRLGDDGSSTLEQVLNALPAIETSAAGIVATAQGPYVYLPGQGYVANPAYGLPTSQPLLQASSSALGVPSLILLGLGAWFLYTVLRR